MYKLLILLILSTLSGCAAISPHDLAPPAPKADNAKAAPVAGECASDPDTLSQDLVKAVQARLTLLGYTPGPIDGVPGDQTHDAVRAYQRDHKLLQDGTITPELLEHIKAMQRVILQGSAVNI